MVIWVLPIFLAFQFVFAQESQKNQQENQWIQIVENDLVVIGKKQKMVELSAVLYNENLNELRNLEIVICKKYNLDLESWRKGLYIWDREKAQFVQQSKTDEDEKKKS